VTAFRDATILAALGFFLCAGHTYASESCPLDQPRSVNPPIPAQENPKVCRFDRPQSATQPSYWWELLYDLFKWKPVSQPPFRRSVAFLAGVSHYNRMSPQLDFVETDLTDFRNFLLTDGGFDTVYEVRDGNVSRQVIEDFMGKYFSNPKGALGPEDRLLFYYSGHGGAQSDVEPYLLFQNADPPYDFSDALPVRDVYRWARTITAKHLLIILDSCFSGLAQGKAGPREDALDLSNALAGAPSGLLLTAGTGDEEAYAVHYSKQRDGSIFTHALIDALRNMSRSEGIVTIGEAFERAKVTVAAFDAVESKKMTPQPIPLERRTGLGKGNFIFINAKAENPSLPTGLYGGGSAIAKAPDADPNLSLIQKEYDEVKNTTNLEALRAFDSAYKGKPYGQTLVYLIEEKIKRIDPEHSHSEVSSKEFVQSTASALKSLAASNFEQHLASSSDEKPTAEANSQQDFRRLVADINANAPIPGVAKGNSSTEYDVILQPGHYQRTTGPMGTRGKYVSEQALVAYLTNIVADTLRSSGRSVLVVSADNYLRPTRFGSDFDGLRSKIFLAIHADGSERPCSIGPSLAYKRPASSLALHAIGFGLATALGYDYSDFHFTATEGRYYMFQQVRAKRLTGVLEVGELTCEKSERELIEYSHLVGVNIGRAIKFVLDTPEVAIADTQTLQSRPLSRVQAEEVLQTQRGNIERCLIGRKEWTSLNFVFQPQPPGLLNIDIFSEIDPQVRQLGHILIPDGTYSPRELDGALDHASLGGFKDTLDAKDKEFIRQTLLQDQTETPATTYEIHGGLYAVVKGLGNKLSIVDPDINRCILSSIRSSIGQFNTTVNDQPLIHRYITDSGVAKARVETSEH
jgi:hypothetical protein